MLRLTNCRGVSSSSGREDWRYLVPFKLNQDIVLRPCSRQGEYWTTTCGNFRIAGFPRSSNLGVTRFESQAVWRWWSTQRGPKSTEDDPEIDVLDKIRVRGRVKISLQPLTPGPKGRAVPGETHVSTPSLGTADVLLKGKQ